MKHNINFRKRVPLALAMLVAASVVVACSDSTEPKEATPSAVAVSTAPPASAEVATAVTGPSVLVTGAGGQPVAGVQVTFAVSGGGAVQFPIATTNEQGIASAGLWQIGPKVGANKVTATVAGLAPVEFTLASAAGPASAMGLSSGNAQSGAGGSTLPLPLAVRVTDAGGNAKPGVAVTFAVTGGGGSLSSTTATTNASGIATSGTWTLGTGQCIQTASATAGSLSQNFIASSRGTIAVGETKAGTLSATDCTVSGKYADEYDLTTAATAINVSLTSTFSPVINAVTADGSALVAQATGTGTASFRLITAAGSKAIQVTSGAAGETGAYDASVTAASTSDVSNCSAVFLEVGATTTQTLTRTDCVYNGVNADVFTVYMAAGKTYRITMQSNPLDALFWIVSPTGTILSETDGQYLANNEVRSFTPSTSGFYRIAATSFALAYPQFPDPGHDYGAYFISVVIP